MSRPTRAAEGALRLVVGCAQMFGAMAGLLLLATSGLTPAAIGVALGTTALTLASRIAFRRRDGHRAPP